MTAGQPLTAVQTGGETNGRGSKRGEVRALKAARPRQGEGTGESALTRDR